MRNTIKLKEFYSYPAWLISKWLGVTSVPLRRTRLDTVPPPHYVFSHWRGTGECR